MSDIERYDMIVSNAGNYMEIRSDGDWVEIDDYERLKSINVEMYEQLKLIQANGNCCLILAALLEKIEKAKQ